MSTKLIRTKPILAGILAVITVTPTYAQYSLEEIVVTARRVSESLQDVPISMTVYTQGDLDQRNIVLAKDLALYTPSLSVDERYGPEKSSFSIRGFNQDIATSPTVAVYFADVVGVRAQGGTTSGNNVGAGAFMDLENVQILKGPQGTLFGRNTNGGAVLLVPRKPTDVFEGYVEGSLGNYDMRRVQGALNVPLTDNFRMRFAVDNNERDGYIRNRSEIGAKDYNNQDYNAFRASAVWDLTPDLENYTIFHMSKSENRGYASRLVHCDRDRATPDAIGMISINNMVTMSACEQIDRQAARGDGPLEIETRAANPAVKIEQWQLINTTTWNLSDNLTLKNIFSYGEYKSALSSTSTPVTFAFPTQ